jgi:hypothetical protein
MVGVPVENSNVQKKRKQNHRSVILTSSSYINEVKEKAAEKKKTGIETICKICARKVAVGFGKYVSAEATR